MKCSVEEDAKSYQRKKTWRHSNMRDFSWWQDASCYLSDFVQGEVGFVFSKSRETCDFETIEIYQDVTSIWIRVKIRKMMDARWSNILWVWSSRYKYRSINASSMHSEVTRKDLQSETLHYLKWIHIWFWICDGNKKSYIYIYIYICIAWNWRNAWYEQEKHFI